MQNSKKQKKTLTSWKLLTKRKVFLFRSPFYGSLATSRIRKFYNYTHIFSAFKSIVSIPIKSSQLARVHCKFYRIRGSWPYLDGRILGKRKVKSGQPPIGREIERDQCTMCWGLSCIAGMVSDGNRNFHDTQLGASVTVDCAMHVPACDTSSTTSNRCPVRLSTCSYGRRTRQIHCYAFRCIGNAFWSLDGWRLRIARNMCAFYGLAARVCVCVCALEQFNGWHSHCRA